MADEVVHRLVDRFPGGESPELCDEELPVEGVGVIPVDLASFWNGQVRVVLVVRVHVDERDRFRVQRLRHVPRDGGLPGPRAAGYSDDQGLHRGSAAEERDRAMRQQNCPNARGNRSGSTVTIWYRAGTRR